MIANNTYIKVAVKASGRGVRNAEAWKKAYLHCHEGRVYLLTHIQTIHDASAAASGCPLHGMRCITPMPGVNAANYAALDHVVMTAHTANVNGVRLELTSAADVVAAVHGSTTRRAPRRAAAPAQTTTPTAPAPAAAPTAAPAAADWHQLDGYTSGQYTGQQSYHASHRRPLNTPTTPGYSYRVGVELEVEFSDFDRREEFTAAPRNWYNCEHDSSLHGAGCEIITIPLLPADAKNRNVWRPLVERLKELGASSWDTRRCGLHVHIGREIFGATDAERESNIARLILFYNGFLADEETSKKVFGRATDYGEERANHNQNRELNAALILGVGEVLKNKPIADRIAASLKRANDTARYFAVNTTNEHTVEFRRGRGSLNADRIQAIITFCEAVCLYVMATPDTANLSVDGFRSFVRANVPTTNALYYYYNTIDPDC